MNAHAPILTGAEEKVLFHQFNYARYRIWNLQQEAAARPDRFRSICACTLASSDRRMSMRSSSSEMPNNSRSSRQASTSR